MLNLFGGNSQPRGPEIIIDNFAGGGGASTGIRMALGRDPDVALNHDPIALAIHQANHPGTEHHCQDLWQAQPSHVVQGRPVGLLWASPDCTHHSKAKGGAPTRNSKIRDLAWVVCKWAREVRPRVIILENVEEFQQWGPLNVRGEIIRERAGDTFRAWKRELRRLGYKVQHRELRACDYGAPTIRKRFFLIARRDGQPIVWPKPTHGPGRAQPYRTAADIIDFSLPCPSIFERKRPLAENTLRRIAAGIKRYVIEAAEPFIVTYYGPRRGGDFRGNGLSEQLGTQTTENRHALVSPVLVSPSHSKSTGRGAHVWTPEEPLRTVTASQDFALAVPSLVGIDQQGARSANWPADKPLSTVVAKNKHALLVPTLITNTSGHAPGSAEEPLPTVTTGGQQALATAFLAGAGGPAFSGKPTRLDRPANTILSENHQALVSTFLAKHYGGVVGQKCEDPLGSITTIDHHSLIAANIIRQFGNLVGSDAEAPLGTVTAGGGGKSALATSHLIKFYGTCKDGTPLDVPPPTVTASGTHLGEVRAFLMKYYGQGIGQSLDDPTGTVTTRDRFGLVTVAGEDYVIADIGLRMLSPRELFLAQGFPSDYVIDPVYNGKPLSKAKQVRACGNSVCPPLAAALVKANCPELITEVVNQ